MPAQVRPRLSDRLATVGPFVGQPAINGDRFRPSDHALTQLYHLGKLGDALDLILKTPSIVSGVAITAPTFTTLDLAVGELLIYDNGTPSVTTRNYNGTAIGAVTNQKAMVYVPFPAVTGFSLAGATLDGSTVNYLKVTVSDAVVQSRNYAYDPGTSYDFLLREAVLITCNSTPAAAHEYSIATVVGDGVIFITVTPTSFLAGIEPPNGRVYIDASGNLRMVEDATRSTVLHFNHTAARTITYPDDSGTLALTNQLVIAPYYTRNQYTVANAATQLIGNFGGSFKIQLLGAEKTTIEVHHTLASLDPDVIIDPGEAVTATQGNATTLNVYATIAGLFVENLTGASVDIVVFRWV